MIGRTTEVEFFSRTSPIQAAGLHLLAAAWIAGSCLAAPERTVADPSFPLAREGKAPVPIVISPGASETVQSVADELAVHLKRITGAPFEVKRGDAATGIVLGTLAEFPTPSLTNALAIRNGFDGREAYAIRTEPERLLLLGATDLGASHAAFRFLELLGCRWFFPAKEWEVVPTIPNLTFSQNETDRPVLLSRRIWYAWGFFKDPGNTPLAQSRPMRDYKAWARHSRMAGSFTINNGHVWQTIITQNKAEFDQHPEYFALVNGERQTKAGPAAKFCVSNPGVQQIAVKYALDYFAKNPNADMVSVEPSDGGGHCECDECRKIGSVSDRVFTLAKIVAKAVAKQCPGKLVGLYAYNFHTEPPSFPLEPNVYVQLTVGFNYGKYTFAELLDLWPKKCPNMGIYQYFSTWMWDQDRLPGGRANNLSYVREQIRDYAAHHATSLDAESSNNWGVHGRGYYLANKLMWNPDADVDALLADFYEKAFGPAAPAMKRYYDRLDAGSKPLLSKDLFARAYRDVDEACRLAKARPDVLTRLDDIKVYLHYNYLRWLIDREPDKDKKKELFLAALTHAYRTRYSYMTHWEGIRQRWTRVASKEFDEPLWMPTDFKSAKPWEVETPVTHDETEKAFREGLTYFQPQPVTERTFSTNWVAVTFGSISAVPTALTFQGNLRYALYSLDGEPLKLVITTGIYPQYRNKPDAQYSLLTLAEEKVCEGRLPLDNEKHAVELKVPKAGPYILDFRDSGAAWKLTAAPGLPVSLLLRRERGFNQMFPGQPLYFYVPKGTKQFHYFWTGSPHQVISPDGKVMQEVKTRDEFVTVPVPEGMDGKPWSFAKLDLGHLWFFNVPNCLAASPTALLVPGELAEEDGLSVR